MNHIKCIPVVYILGLATVKVEIFDGNLIRGFGKNRETAIFEDFIFENTFILCGYVLVKKIFEAFNFEENVTIEYIEIKFPSKISTFTVCCKLI